MSIEILLNELIEENKSLENTKKYKRYHEEINRRIEANNKLIADLQKEPVKTIETEIDKQVEEIKEIVEGKDKFPGGHPGRGRKNKKKDLTIAEDLDTILEVIQPF